MPLTPAPTYKLTFGASILETAQLITRKSLNMVNPNFYTLLPNGPVHARWFEAQLTRYNTRSDILRDTYLSAEIKALKDFHDGTTSTAEAAQAITRPISTNPVPSIGTSSDAIVPVTQLWRLYKDALVEWPSNRTQDLVTLGVAISELPDHLHRGEALDDNDERSTLAWKDVPYIHMVWRDAHWQRPVDLVEKCKDDEARRHARDVYLKQQEVEAQLVAANLFEYKLAFREVIIDLEIAKKPEDKGDHDPATDGDFEPLELDFHISAAARWIKHNGGRMRVSLVEKELKDLPENSIPRGARHFERQGERWQFWERRFGDVARDEEADEFTRREAQAGLDAMKAISGSG